MPGAIAAAAAAAAIAVHACKPGHRANPIERLIGFLPGALVIRS